MLYAVPDPRDFVFDREPITVGQFTIGIGGREGRTNRFAVCSKEHGIVEFGMDEAAEAIARLVAKETAA